jgi:hypothetical protein
MSAGPATEETNATRKKTTPIPHTNTNNKIRTFSVRRETIEMANNYHHCHHYHHRGYNS